MKNALASILLQVATALSGIIVPRFFTAFYGSAVNGLVSSIGQFITYMGLVEAGISAAGVVALYKPLAEEDHEAISGIVSAARKFYYNSGLIFIILDVLLIIAYPFIVQNEITDIGFIRMMIVILSVNGIVDYFFLGKYRVLLTADQRNYIISLVQIAGIVVITVVSIVMIKLEMSALLVKGVVAVVYVARSIVVIIYARRRYPYLDLKAKPKTEAIAQRWNALLHQIVGMICNNTDIILLTLCLTAGALSEVSVYSVYALVGYALINLFIMLSNGVTATFGQVMSVGDEEPLKRGFDSYEYFCFILVFTAYSCMAVLLMPFMQLYSADFSDAQIYTRWLLVGLFTAVGLLQSIRIPGLTLIMAAGHYKQTQSRAIAEAVINLGVSLALVFKFGIYGVLIGTCVSYLYRSTDVILYSAKRFIKGTLKKTILRLIRNAAVFAILVFLGIKFIPVHMDSWILWILWALLAGFVSLAVLMGVNLIFEPAVFKDMLGRIKGMLKR